MKVRAALVCDFLEEAWPSMDLCAEMLLKHLGIYADQIAAQQIRAPFRSWFGGSGHLSGLRLLRNADRFLNRFWTYPRWLRPKARQFDLFHIIDHSYAHLVHDVPRERTVVTCHDLDAFRCLLSPKTEERPAWFRRMAERILTGLQSAAHVICISAATQAELLRHKLVSSEKSSVIHNGYHPAFQTRADAMSEASSLSELGIGRGETEYILNVGSTIPRKRIDILLRIFASACDRHSGLTLVRVGGPLTLAQQSLAHNLGIAHRVLSVPFVSPAVLAALYRNAALLIQTSDREGFGLPVLEAMACGLPVIGSDIPAFREVGGSSITLCPTDCSEPWLTAIDRELSIRRKLPEQRAALSRELEAQASRFTWAANAAQVRCVYRRVCLN